MALPYRDTPSQNHAPEVYAHDAPEVYPAGLELTQPGQPGLEVRRTAFWQNEKIDNVHARAMDLTPNEQPTPKRTILGLRRPTFWLLLALIIAIIAAIVSGVVAGEVHCNNVGATSPTDVAPTATVTVTKSSTLTPTTTSTSSASASSSPTSDCGSGDSSYTGILSLLTYGKFCNTYLDSGVSDYSNLFNSNATTFDNCIATCDSFNYWTKTSNATVAVWNWSGASDQTPGTCWCVKMEGDFNLTVTSGQDSARLLGAQN